MGKEPCGNTHSVVEIGSVVEQRLQRICAALDAMPVADVRRLIDEIETEMTDD